MQHEYKSSQASADSNGQIHGSDSKTNKEYPIILNPEKNIIDTKDKKLKQSNACAKATGTVIHYLVLLILGSLTWCMLWLAFGDEWSWDGRWFRIAIVGVVAWGSGQVLEMSTSLPPLLAALTTGILARNTNFLDMRHYTEIDSFLRKIYPVIILGKGSLAWNVDYIKHNWKQVYSLGVLPWLTEVIVIASSTHLTFGFPWLWGFLLASFYASVSCPILMPTVKRVSAGKNLAQNWPQLICTSSGTDTALSVVLFGVMHSFVMYEGDSVYFYVKVVFGVLVGLVAGVSWGALAKFVPHSTDYYVTELRILYVVIGGLFLSFLTTYLGWGGSAGLAVLACNCTAANQWKKDGWQLGNNPACTSYQVMWSTLEPLVFAYTGTFVVLKSPIFSSTIYLGLGVLLICLAVRLTVAFLVGTTLTVRERLFVCCTWIPKSIVEAVLCPVAINTLISKEKHHSTESVYADTIVILTAQAILITTPIGFLFTKYLGPLLLKEEHKKADNETNA